MLDLFEDLQDLQQAIIAYRERTGVSEVGFSVYGNGELWLFARTPNFLIVKYPKDASTLQGLFDDLEARIVDDREKRKDETIKKMSGSMLMHSAAGTLTYGVLVSEFGQWAIDNWGAEASIMANDTRANMSFIMAPIDPRAAAAVESSDEIPF